MSTSIQWPQGGGKCLVRTSCAYLIPLRSDSEVAECKRLFALGQTLAQTDPRYQGKFDIESMDPFLANNRLYLENLLIVRDAIINEPTPMSESSQNCSGGSQNTSA